MSVPQKALLSTAVPALTVSSAGAEGVLDEGFARGRDGRGEALPFLETGKTADRVLTLNSAREGK